MHLRSRIAVPEITRAEPAATIEAAAPQWRYVNPDDRSELVGVRSSVMSPTLALAGRRPT